MINRTSKVLSELNICLYDNSGSMKKATDLICEIGRAFENLTEDQKKFYTDKIFGISEVNHHYDSADQHRPKGIRRKCIRCRHEGVTYTNNEVVAFCPVCDGNYVDLFRWGTVNMCANKKPDKRPETKIAELEKRIEALEEEKQSNYTIDNLIVNVSDHVDVDKIVKALQDKVERTVKRTYMEGSD